jgi:chaperonin GroEL
MQNKNITIGTDARSKLISGINKLNNATVSTLGPNGQCVAIQTKNGLVVTKDGVSVARSIKLADPEENLGVDLIKQVSSETADKAGDGTTTSTLLATEMINAGFQNVIAGANGNQIKSGMEYARKVYTDILKTKYVKQIENENSINHIATISANNDEELGNLIAEAIKTVGVNGAINIDNSNTAETYTEVIEGLKIEHRGYLSPYMVTNENRGIAELNNPLILMTMAEINFNTEIMVALDIAKKADRPILIIADAINGEALNTIVLNKMRGILQIAAIRAPMFGELKLKYMEDIAILTGGKIFNTPKNNRKISEVTLQDFGHAGKVIVSQDETTIIEGGGTLEELDHRILSIEEELESLEPGNQMIKDALEERIAKLSGGVCRLYIGAHSEAELKEKKDRLEDALHATRAAIEEGIVVGGGVTNLKIQADMREVDLTGKATDFITGYNIVVNALDKPIQKILSNSTTENVGEVLWNVKHSTVENYGYNALTKQYCDLMESGVIDPARVTRVSLETAVSAAGTVLTTNCLITDIEDNRTVVNF